VSTSGNGSRESVGWGAPAVTSGRDQPGPDPYARPGGTRTVRPDPRPTPDPRTGGSGVAPTTRAPRTAAGTRAVDELPTGRVRVVEKFTGRRVKHRTGALRRLRSMLGLLVIAVIVAAVVAAIIAAVVGSIALAIQHALNNN
jgi:hypothetical protein